MDRSHQLRSYQRTAVDATRAHWVAGRRRVCVVAPTGAGKTTIAAAAMQCARSPLALVHTRTLRDQARRRLGKHVRVLTIQGALRRGVRLDGHDVVFVDECHHLGSRSWSRVLALLAPTVLVLGCTATPQRADGTALGVGGAGFDALVATASYSELLRAGHLASCRVVPAGRFRGDPAGAYLALGGGRPAIVFAPTRAACNAAVARLVAADVRAAVIDAHTSAAHRTWAFEAYDRGALDVLASPMALAEGFDSPRAAVCVLDRSCDHVGTYLQTAGRVLRPHPSKGPASPAVVLDLRGAAARHGNPTDDRTYSLEGTGIASVAPAARRRSTPAAARRHPAAPAASRTRAATPRPPAQAAGYAVGRALAQAWGWLRGALAA